MNPIEQINLHGYKNLFNLFIKLDGLSKIPRKFIISGQKGIGKSTFAFHLINYFFSREEEYNYGIKIFSFNHMNKSFNLVKNLSHPNFFLIDIDNNKKNIDIEKIRKALLFSNKSSFNNKDRIVLIDNVEFLSVNSANALLKIIEEPNDNLVFILIHNSSYKLLDTIKSRCLEFKVNFDKESSLNIFKELIDNHFQSHISNDITSCNLNVGDLFFLKNICDDNNFDLKNSTIKDIVTFLISTKKIFNNYDNLNFITKFIQIFYHNKMIKKFKNETFDEQKLFLKKLSEAKKFNLDLENIFIEFQSKILNG